MQDYPVRERIYLPVVRFGVPHTDWKYVFLLTFAGFVLPFVFRITIYGVPAPMLTGVLALASAVAFFNFIRIGRRPFWFQHTLRALLGSRTRRAALPTDGLNEPWVRDFGDTGDAPAHSVFQFSQ
jgi:hypothetical protein